MGKILTGPLSSSFEYRTVEITVYVHDSIKHMQEDFKDSLAMKDFTKISDSLSVIRAITLGRYCDKGHPKISVFLPVDTNDNLTVSIPHEAGHVSLAIIRHEIANSIAGNTPVHIIGKEDVNSDYGIEEEMLCIMIGEIAATMKAVYSAIIRTKNNLGPLIENDKDRYGEEN